MVYFVCINRMRDGLCIQVSIQSSSLGGTVVESFPHVYNISGCDNLSKKYYCWTNNKVKLPQFGFDERSCRSIRN